MMHFRENEMGERKMVDKNYLKRHLQHRMELKEEQEWYALCTQSSMMKAINMDGMPHGSGGAGDMTFCNILEKVETEKKIKDLNAVIEKEYEQINEVFGKMKNPTEKKILKLRYFQCLEWTEIRKLEFGGRRDYYDNAEKYKNKVFKIHGAAIKHLKEVQS